MLATASGCAGAYQSMSRSLDESDGLRSGAGTGPVSHAYRSRARALAPTGATASSIYRERRSSSAGCLAVMPNRRLSVQTGWYESALQHRSGAPKWTTLEPSGRGKTPARRKVWFFLGSRHNACDLPLNVSGCVRSDPRQAVEMRCCRRSCHHDSRAWHLMCSDNRASEWLTTLCDLPVRPLIGSPGATTRRVRNSAGAALRRRHRPLKH
jgi:hypothetical protein